MVEASVDLHGAEAEGGGYSKEGADHGESVDEITEATMDSFTEEGLKGRTKGQRKTTSKTKKGKCESDDGVNRPRV